MHKRHKTTLNRRSHYFKMQTKKMSAIESVVNIVVGYSLSILVQIVVFPIFGLEIKLSQNMAIALIFTFVSVARSYTLRRLFNFIS